MRAVLNCTVAFDALSDYFKDKEAFKLVVLYGSAAKGNLCAHSDIDLALAGNCILDRDLLFATAAELSVLLGREIDLIDLRRIDGLILYRVMTEGKRIKTDANLFVKYRLKALGYYEDFKPLQDKMRNARITRFINGS